MWLKKIVENNYPVSILLALSKTQILAGIGGVLSIIDLREYQQTSLMPGHRNPITSLSASFDGKKAFSTDTQSARIWDLIANKPIALFNMRQLSSIFEFGEANPQWTRAATAGQKSLIIWNLEIEEVDYFHNFDEKVIAIKVEHEGNTVFAVLQGGSIISVNMFEKDYKVKSQISIGNLARAVFDSDAQKLLVFTNPPTMPVIVDQNGAILHSFPDASEAKLGAFIDNGRFLVLSSDRRIWLFYLGISSHRLLFFGDTGDGVLESLTVASDGRYVCLGFHSGNIQLWELDYEVRFP